MEVFLKYSSAYDIAVMVTGDSDFLPLISYLKNLKDKKQVYIFSTEGSVSNELRTGGDGYFDIAEFSDIHGDELKNAEDKSVSLEANYVITKKRT